MAEFDAVVTGREFLSLREVVVHCRLGEGGLLEELSLGAHVEGSWKRSNWLSSSMSGAGAGARFSLKHEGSMVT
jgi:hypothetical protein